MKSSSMASKSIHLTWVLALTGMGLAWAAAETGTALRVLLGALAVLIIAGAGACIGTLGASREAERQAFEELKKERRYVHQDE